MLHNEPDIAFARLAADEAKEQALKLCQQMHWSSLLKP